MEWVLKFEMIGASSASSAGTRNDKFNIQYIGNSIVLLLKRSSCSLTAPTKVEVLWIEYDLFILFYMIILD